MISRMPIKERIVDLDRGLYSIQYTGSDDKQFPPHVIVKPAPGYESAVELILHPDAANGTLRMPGSQLIVRTRAPAQLSVEVVPFQPNGSRSASLKFEPMKSGDQSQFHLASPPSSAVRFDSLLLLGHIAGRGDVVVGPNVWIGGPQTPARIEGIALEWPDKPSHISLRYAVKTMSQTATPQLLESPTFSGTRGKALAIAAVTLEISSNEGAGCQLVAEGLFLSSPALRTVGSRIVLSGPTGREPLVGLRISIAGDRAMSDISDAQMDESTDSPTLLKSRVRVFRSRTRPQTPAG